MIYYKRKTVIKKIANIINKNLAKSKGSTSSFCKNLFILFSFVLLFLYCAYIFLLPNLIKEKNITEFANNYLLNNTNLSLDIQNLTIKTNYKLDLNIKAKHINLVYPNKKNFLAIENPNLNIKIFPLLFKQINIKKASTDSITLNTIFTKTKKYDFYKYFVNANDSTTSLFKIKNLNLNCKNISLNIFDENIKEAFKITSKDLKITFNDYTKNFNIKTNGLITTSKHKIADFNINLSAKTNAKSINDFKNKIISLNYNPLMDAYKYRFYSLIDVNLKINSNKNDSMEGKIKFDNFTFKLKNISLPKNTILLTFKENLATSNCNFKLINNQHINISTKISLSKNKSIETKLNSNNINLANLNELIVTLNKILNSNKNLNNIDLSGLATINLYLKSDFKIITSSGHLLINNAKLHHKNSGLIINNINSNVNLENNSINITNTSAFIKDAKLNIYGSIDSKTNMNLKVVSDLIDIAQINLLLKDLRLNSKTKLISNDIILKNGLIKIDSKIRGNFSNPTFETNSFIENFSAYNKKLNLHFANSKTLINSNSKDIDVTLLNSNFKTKYNNGNIPKLNLKITNDSIIIPKSLFYLDKLPLEISGKIDNFKSKDSEGIFNIIGKNLSKNKVFYVNKNNINLNSQLTLKGNNLHIDFLKIADKHKDIAQITGTIENLDAPILKELSINIPEKTDFIMPSYKNLTFSAQGNLTVNNSLKQPDITGKLNLYEIYSQSENISIKDILITAKNSDFYINIDKGNVFNFNFGLVAQANYSKNKLIFSYLHLNSPYINFDNLKEHFKNPQQENVFEYEINNFEGNISTLELADLILNSLHFKGNIKNHILNIDNFSADIFEGKMTGRINLDLRTQETKTQLNVEEMSIRHLSSKLKEISIATSGKLSTITDIKFKGFNLENIIKTIEGKINFKINNGELSQFAKLERFLQAGNILSQSFSKLTLNSTLSAITKQNTGDFKTIEGEIDIKDSIANIEHINTQGTNMSLHITGKLNLLTNYIDTKVLGKIPNSIVNVMGNFGDFSLEKTMNINSLSKIEKMFSTKISKEDLEKIPPLAYAQNSTNVRNFVVYIKGLINNITSIQNFKWHLE